MHRESVWVACIVVFLLPGPEDDQASAEARYCVHLPFKRWPADSLSAGE
jgi:hypothetical protein